MERDGHAHLHYTVKWNEEEKSWDCPCHGSHFGSDDKVLNGLAVGPLKNPSKSD